MQDVKKPFPTKRDKFYFGIARFPASIIAATYGYKYQKFNCEKGKSYIIVSNHQSVMDPIFVALSFKTPIYTVANDSLFNNSFVSKLLVHCFSPIKKKKSQADINCVKNCIKISRDGGNLLIFPEGNRAWADFQFTIEPSITKLIKKLDSTLLLYNLDGGYGADPRWGGKRRKGKFTGKVVKAIEPEQLKQMTDEQLHREIVTTLRVIDSDSGRLYKSKRRAEFLERELFICPVCGKLHTLYSKGARVVCKNCNTVFSYGENLRFSCDNDKFRFDRLVDWYKYQLEFLKTAPIEQLCFTDNDVLIYEYEGLKRVGKQKGVLSLTQKSINLGSYNIDLKKVTSATVVGGIKMIINIENRYFLFKGNKRFNAIKYVLALNRFETNIAGEKYYGLDI